MTVRRFNNGDADADLVVVGSGVVGALIAEQIAGAQHSVLVLDAGPRLDRAQVVKKWRNMNFKQCVSSDFQSLYPS